MPVHRPEAKYLTLGDVARHFRDRGIETWHVQKAIQRGFFPAPKKVGSFRVILEEELPAFEEALQKAGYLK